MSKKVLYIGNKLQKHGVNPTTIDLLSELLQRESISMITASNKLNKFSRFFDMIYKLVTNRKQVSIILIDTYSTQNFIFAFVCGWLARSFGIPYVPILNGGGLPLLLKSKYFMVKLYFDGAKLLVAPSKYLKVEFEKYGYDALLIPNVLDFSKYEFKNRSEISPNILFVRAFDSIYNPKMAIEVLASLSIEYPNAKLCMVGPDKDGTLAEVKKLARQLGVYSQIEFKGQLPKEQWLSIAKDYDVFINTSNVDNTPVSVLEAMALGLIVVSTNVGGLPYLINDKYDGYLVGKRASIDMANTIALIIKNPKEQILVQKNAQAKAESFEWSNVKGKWLSILSKNRKVKL